MEGLPSRVTMAFAESGHRVTANFTFDTVRKERIDKNRAMEKAESTVRFRLRGWRLWSLLAVLAYTLIGFFLLPWIIQRQLVGFGETRLQRPMTVERVRVNPYALSLTIDGLRLDETDGTPLGALGQFHVNFETSSLLRRAWTFKELRFTGPYVNFVRFEDGGNNFQRLAESLRATAPPETGRDDAPGDEGGLPRLILRHVILDDGAVDVADLSRETDFETQFRAINLELSSLNTLPNKEAGHSFRVVTETGAEIVWTGRLQPNPVRLSGHLDAVGERPRLIWRYMQDEVDFEIADGQVTLSLDLDVTAADGSPQVTVDNIAYTLTDLLLRPKGIEQDVLRIPRLALSGGRLRLPDRTFHLQEARIEGARLKAFRDGRGILNLVDLLQAGEPTTEVPATNEKAAPVTEALGQSAVDEFEDVDTSVGVDTEPATGEAGPPDEPGAEVPAAADDAWLFTLASLVVDDFGADFEDRSLTHPLTSGVENLMLGMTDFSTAPGSQFRLEFASDVTTGGRVTAGGDIGLKPRIAELDVDIQSLSIDPLEPLISDQISLRLLSGDVSLNGRLRHDEDEVLGFSGAAQINDLVTEDTILNERFAAWKALSMPSIELALDGGTLAIDTIALDAPYGKLTVERDGTTNINDVFATRQAADVRTEIAVSPAPGDNGQSASPLRIDVGRVVIKEGSANFADMSLPLPFATAIHSMAGEIGNISSAGERPATVKIAGQVDESGSADINGELDPFGPKDHLKMDVVFQNVHMPRLTPYSAKFAGREIEGGKLNLDLKYRIEEGQLASENNILIEKLRLGDKVESPEAMNLPLDLAVALLQDSQGRIDLDLPVTGDLNDPEFHYGSVAWKAIGNILLKAVTAPFKLLGALIPGGGEGEQLEFIEFEPGTATLSDAETAELDTIAEAIGKRPQLVLKVPSAYSATTDKQAIQTARLSREVESRLPGIDTRDGVSAERIALEQIYVEAYSQTELDNLEAANTRAADESGGRAQLDEAAYLSSLTRSLRDDQVVATAELESLGDARAQAIIDYLVDKAGASKEQISKSPITTVEPNAEGKVQLKFEVGSDASGNRASVPAQTSTPEQASSRD